MTALVSLLFIAMIPIDCKITISFLHLLYRSIIISMFYVNVKIIVYG